jgi:hypothetical protein
VLFLPSLFKGWFAYPSNSGTNKPVVKGWPATFCSPSEPQLRYLLVTSHGYRLLKINVKPDVKSESGMSSNTMTISANNVLFKPPK